MTKQRFSPGELLSETLREAEGISDHFAVFLAVRDAQELLPVFAGLHVNKILPVIREVLDESERLLAVNASASLVWSIQAFELFVKEGLCRPALFQSLPGDFEGATEVYRTLFERNGGKAAADLLGSLFGLDFLKIQAAAGPQVWDSLVRRETGFIARRNKIIHRGDQATKEEAVGALSSVRVFVDAVVTRFEESRREYHERYGGSTELP